MNRRDFTKASTLTVFGAGLPFSGAQAQSRFAKYAGKTVVMSVPAHSHYDAMTKLLPDFTKETGIKVEIDKIAMGRMKDKQLLEMSKPSGDYDLGCYIVMWKGEYVAKNLIQPLEPFFANAALADPAYDMNDIVPIYLQNLGLVGGPKGYLPARWSPRRRASRTTSRPAPAGSLWGRPPNPSFASRWARCRSCRRPDRPAPRWQRTAPAAGSDSSRRDRKSVV